MGFNWDVHEDFSILPAFRKNFPPVHELHGDYIIKGSSGSPWMADHIIAEHKGPRGCMTLTWHDPCTDTWHEKGKYYASVEDVEKDITVAG